MANIICNAVRLRNGEQVKTLMECGVDIDATDKDDKTAFFFAVLKEDENMVETLIQGGADIDTTNEDGQTALFYAVKKEKEEMVEKLIECGAGVNAADKNGDTALFLAVSKENQQMVQKIVERGADINYANHYGQTALFCAVRQEKEDMVEKLIKCGADVNAADKNGLTALFYAVNEKNEKLVEKLIECGANINAKYEDGETALFCAVREENGDMFQRLFECGADINATDKNGDTALFLAVLKENENLVQKLVQNGADIDTTNEDGQTALFYAITNEKEEMVEKLIECGADVNATDKEGKSALFFAVSKENRKMVQKLVKCGADINSGNQYGRNVLFDAVRQEMEDMVETLIECGADINATDKNGDTALFCAVLQKNEKLIQKIVKWGANINATDKNDETAFFYAVSKEKEEIVEKLIECGADVNATGKNGDTALFLAVSKENENLVQKLVENGADINSANQCGQTALFYAVRKENGEMVEKLIKCGADINATDKEGKTALFHALREEKEGMFEKLIECGADINAIDKNGATALLYAVQEENKKMVPTLVERGANVNAADKDGKTALFYAVRKEKKEMVEKLLIEYGADVNAADKDGETALFCAMTQSLSLARYLLDKGATLQLNENCSVLTFFIEKCVFNLSGGKTKLQNGLNLLTECKGVKGKTILEAIASVAFCKTLCFKPGSCDIDAHFLSELMSLAKGKATKFKVNIPVGKNKIVIKISKMINKECFDKPLIESRDALELPQLLIKLGANPDTTDSDGNTALHHATQLAFHGVTRESIMEIFQKLEKLNVSFHITNHQNETPLLYCLTRTIEKVSREEEPWSTLKTQAAVCRFLVEHGSSVEAKTGSGETVLHLTIKLLQQGFFKQNRELREDICNVALELLEVFVLAFKRQEVSINTKDNIGNTPLHVWAKLQLAPGQDYSSNIAGEEYTFQGLLKMILDHFRENEGLLHAKDEKGETPLHLCRTWTAVELLLDAGASPKDVDSSGRTPLLVAAKNSQDVMNPGSLYQDILMVNDKFWRTVLLKSLNPWTADRYSESVLSVLLKSESHDLAKSLVDVACDQNSPANPLVLFSLLTTICKDKSPNSQWKKDAAEMILCSTKCQVNGNAKEDSPLHYCCRNIVEASKTLPMHKVQSTVHWSLAKLLREQGADYRIPDATDQSCLDIAKEFLALKDLLMEPIDLDRFPVLIKPWKSVSKKHERCLAKVARHVESEDLKSHWYYKDQLASGSFGAVYAGINKKDGREVAIKRIEKRHMQRPEDKREIENLTALADCEQVVLYLHFFEDKHFSYIVLELMEGNLDELLAPTIEINTRVQLCQDVVMGLVYLHNQNILHRDLKSANILYKRHPKLCLKIADFGLSRRVDCASTNTVYGTNAGTRCWIAPEVLKSTKPHSKSSDVFACGLVLHYILSVKTHPFSSRIGALQHEIEANILNGNIEGWDDSLCPEAANLVKAMLDGDKSKRPSADKALDHPFFWSKKKKLDLLIAVGNQQEFVRRTIPLTAVEIDLEKSFGTIVKYADWNDPGYVHMPAIYMEMRSWRRYNKTSVVELVRFIRNAHAHVTALPKPIQNQLLKHFVFLEYFPNLVMEVYKAVTTHGWDQMREEIKHALR